MVPVYLGLGGNLGDVRHAMDEAIRLLVEERSTRLVKRGPLYRSKPVGPPGQPDYLNTAVQLTTALSPEDLLVHLKNVEKHLGRTAGIRWGARPIDLDILLYSDVRVDTGALVIPHRELSRRRFVLAPLADIAPDLAVPGLNATVSELLAALKDDPLDVVLA